MTARRAPEGRTVLDIDETAISAIKELTDAAGVAPRGGLRIARTPDQRFDLSIAARPGGDDEVVTSEDGARVFLEPRAAEVLSEKVLDVRTDDDGRFHFGVYPKL
ncbi:Fe-S cluster assembly iron-binding protein IscA [Saccharothrix ecbatanensis]|uniref:Fe-S cluster assembly iron-binding protein IscA n=1 Tax=Saccharothrix ecbatanensis TaxID=1105145 RepID=A0A7W9HL16_9PSEU|nr:Fe-S cluster assembly iron-binding protein IscA [Saccharothrix ecbatanensis]